MIDPVAFHLGTYPIRWYGLMMFLGLLLGYLILKKIFKENNIDRHIALEYYLYVVIGLFIGCRIFEVLFYDPVYYFYHPLRVLYIWEGGLSSHGGIVFGTLAAYYYCKKKHFPFWKFADLCIIPIALAAGLVRVGNFLNGEIVGRVTSLPWKMQFPNYEGLRHPVQLYEAAKNFFIFGLLYHLRDKKLPEGFLYWSFIFLFSFLRFFTEFFKEYQIFSSGLTIGQWLSLPFIIVSGVMIYKVIRKKSPLSEVKTNFP